MNALRVVAAAAAAASLAAVAASGPATAAPAGPTFTNPTSITNPYLPISSVRSATLEGTKEGMSVRSVRERLRSTKQFVVNGRSIQAVTVRDTAYENNVLHEVALDYYAQADDGTVYYLGEDVDIHNPDGTITHEGAWLYGVDTKTLGVAMPANPQPRDRWTFEKVPGLGSESNQAITRSLEVTVPAGTFSNVLQVDGKLSPGGESETKYYAPGVGNIKESDAGGSAELTAIKLG